MAEYQLIAHSESVLRRADQAHIPPDPANRDRQEYEAWLYAVNHLAETWDTFWTAAKPSIEQLDNGVRLP